MLEKFAILLYDRTSQHENIDVLRLHLFTCSLPPTKGALIQHTRRAVLQGAHVWGQALVATPIVPSPVDWGWTEPSSWKPKWTDLPEASVACRELLCCGCKKGCRGNCKCRKAALQCTALCQCLGECER